MILKLLFHHYITFMKQRAYISEASMDNRLFFPPISPSLPSKRHCPAWFFPRLVGYPWKQCRLLR